MDLSVRAPGPAAPFRSARDIFETAFDLDLPVTVNITPDPDQRTLTAHYPDHHQLTISAHAASSAMARELALHEYAHMRRYEEQHPSHTQSTDEIVFLAFAGHKIERRIIHQCYQIANHIKDIYADDITLTLSPCEKLVSFFESELATALADRPQPPTNTHWERRTPASDPDITAINAAFALALLERHDCISPDHRLYDLAHAAANDAPNISLDQFKHRFRSLARDPDESEYRKSLVNIARDYADHTGQFAD